SRRINQIIAQISGAGSAAARPQSIGGTAFVPDVLRNVGNRRLGNGRRRGPVFAWGSVLIENRSPHSNVERSGSQCTHGQRTGRRRIPGIVATFRSIVSGRNKVGDTLGRGLLRYRADPLQSSIR